MWFHVTDVIMYCYVLFQLGITQVQRKIQAVVIFFGVLFSYSVILATAAPLILFFCAKFGVMRPRAGCATSHTQFWA